MSIAIHIGISLVDRRNILASEAERRHYARLITRIGESYGLIGHGLPDDHGHSVVTCDRRRAGVFAQALESAMRQSLGIAVPFRRAYFKSVRDQAHLRSLIPYVHRQAEHHGVEIDPYFEASSLPDLFGARLIAGGGCLREALARVAPRVKPARQLPDALKGRSGSRPTIEQAAVAAAAAIGQPSLHGQDAITQAARRAALAAAWPAGRERRAAALACSVRTVTRLLREPAQAELVAAVRMQAHWRFGGGGAEREVGECGS